jgi:hypothetical protein
MEKNNFVMRARCSSSYQLAFPTPRQQVTGNLVTTVTTARAI